MIRPIRIANDVFSRVRKMIRPIRSHRGVWVSRQNSRLYCSVQRRFAHIQREKFYSKNFSHCKSENISEMEWNSFVSFTVDKENGKNRTRRKLLLFFLSELLCLSFKLKLILKPAILLKFTHFQFWIENKQLR